MSKFVILINYTAEGLQDFTDLPRRLKASREKAAELGVTLESYHLTFGRYDAVAIIEAPDEPTAAQFILSHADAGYVRTETMTAFSEDQISAIASGLLDD